MINDLAKTAVSVYTSGVTGALRGGGLPVEVNREPHKRMHY